MHRLTHALAATVLLGMAGPAFADASPQPPVLDERGDAMRAGLSGVWVYIPRPQGSAALRTQSCAHSDPFVTAAPEFAAFGPHALRLSFGADSYGIVTRQVVGGRDNQIDRHAAQVWDHLNIVYWSEADDEVIQVDWGDGIYSMLVRLDAGNLLVADDPVHLFQGAWLLTKCPEMPG